MALARGRRGSSEFNYWPGFVDALSTLILAIVFILTVFVVVQFFLSQEVSGKDKALEQLNAKIAQLNDLLSLEKLDKLGLTDELARVRAGLAGAEADRDRVKGLYEGLAKSGTDAASRAGELNKALDSEKQISARALAQVEVLNQQISALRRQLSASSVSSRSAWLNPASFAAVAITLGDHKLQLRLISMKLMSPVFRSRRNSIRP